VASVYLRSLGSVFFKRGLARSVAATLVLQLSSAGLIFVISVSLARILGQTHFGVYEYVDSWLEVLLMFTLLGFDRLLVRLLSAYQSQEDWGRMRGSWRTGLHWSLLAAGGVVITLAGLLLFLVAMDLIKWSAFLPDVPPEQAEKIILPTFLLGLVLVPIRVLVRLNQAGMQGVGHVVWSQLPDFVIRPLFLWVSVGVVYLITRSRLSAATAVELHVVAALLALMFSLYLLRKSLPDRMRLAKPAHVSGLRSSAVPLLLLSGMGLLSLRGGNILLGVVTDLKVVAMYGASVRVVALVSLAMGATNAVLAPQIARLYTQGDRRRLQRLVIIASQSMVAVSIPITLFMIFGGQYLLRLFGKAYVSAHPALIIMSLGQLISVASGPVAWLLMMTGHEWDAAIAATIGACSNLVLIAILAPTYGLEGAAIATAVSMALRNLISMWQVWHRLGIRTTGLMPRKLVREGEA
jgi:O-antigen/teichoic acid export membrane protein